MRPIIGIILLVVGAGLALYGLGSALSAFASLYQGALADALNQPEGTERAASENMWRAAMVGLAGVPLLMIGSFLLGRGLLARWRRGTGTR